jgi:hypothetical protein
MKLERMARIQWAQLCELAFLDDCDRLCMIGLMNRFPVPSLPIVMRQLMIVVRIADTTPGETFGVSVSIAAPDGPWTSPDLGEGLEVGVAGDYLLVTLRDIPLMQEGMYRFQVSMGEDTSLILEAPVRVASKPATRRGHAEQQPTLAIEETLRIRRTDIN